jgi:hypothetical protein
MERKDHGQSPKPFIPKAQSMLHKSFSLKMDENFSFWVKVFKL